jgi:DNA-binding transcriptional LysR family regulator
MDVRQLRNALAVIERGSIGKAAELLRISQPALTKSIRRLEDGLQVKLFERNSRGMQPTVYGECLRSHARAVNASLDQLRADLHALKSGAQGIVEVGAPPIVAPEVFPRAIAKLNKECPQVLVRLSTELSPQLMRAVQIGSLDFVISFMANDEPPPGCSHKFLFSDQLVVAARAGHPITRSRKVTVRDLVGCSWMLPHKDNLHRQRLELAFEAAGMPLPQPVIECNSVPFVKAALQETDCVTLISKLSVKAEEKSGLIQSVELDSDFMTRRIGVTWRDDRGLSMAAQRLLAIIEKAYGKPH